MDVIMYFYYDKTLIWVVPNSHSAVTGTSSGLVIMAFAAGPHSSRLCTANPASLLSRGVRLKNFKYFQMKLFIKFEKFERLLKLNFESFKVVEMKSI